MEVKKCRYDFARTSTDLMPYIQWKMSIVKSRVLGRILRTEGGGGVSHCAQSEMHAGMKRLRSLYMKDSPLAHPEMTCTCDT